MGCQLHRQQCHSDIHASQVVEALDGRVRGLSCQEAPWSELCHYQEIHSQEMGRLNEGNRQGVRSSRKDMEKAQLNSLTLEGLLQYRRMVGPSNSYGTTFTTEVFRLVTTCTHFQIPNDRSLPLKWRRFSPIC